MSLHAAAARFRDLAAERAVNVTVEQAPPSQWDMGADAIDSSARS